MSTLNEAKMPRLADKLEAREKDLAREAVAVETELKAVKRAKNRAKKD